MEFKYARSKICGWQLHGFDDLRRVLMMVGDGRGFIRGV